MLGLSRLSSATLAMKLAALGAVFFATACATSGTSGFDEADISTGADLASYNSVYIADVAVAPELANRDTRVSTTQALGKYDRPVSQRDLAELAGDIQGALSREVGRVKTTVPAPRPGALTVQATLVDVASNRPTMADVSAQPGLSQQSVYAGGVEIAIVLSDGSEQLATLVERYDGMLQDDVGPPSTWEDANRGIDITARKLAQLLISPGM